MEGVYETQVPLLFKFLVVAGCCCKLNAGKNDKVRPVNRVGQGR